jgi:hypothetical protein
MVYAILMNPYESAASLLLLGFLILELVGRHLHGDEST